MTPACTGTSECALTIVRTPINAVNSAVTASFLTIRSIPISSLRSIRHLKTSRGRQCKRMHALYHLVVSCSLEFMLRGRGILQPVAIRKANSCPKFDGACRFADRYTVERTRRSEHFLYPQDELVAFRQVLGSDLMVGVDIEKPLARFTTAPGPIPPICSRTLGTGMPLMWASVICFR